MSARDPLRARLPRGFRAARDGYAPRFIWGGPIGIAVLYMLVLGTPFCGNPAEEGHAERERASMPLLPSSGARACLSLSQFPGYRPMRSDEEGVPVMFAVWTDGTFVWSEHAPDAPGRPYRTGAIPPEAVQRLLASAQSQLESLRPESRFNSVNDSTDTELVVESDAGEVVLSWSPDVLLAPDIEAVRRGVITAVLAARPAASRPAGIEEFVFSDQR